MWVRERARWSSSVVCNFGPSFDDAKNNCTFTVATDQTESSARMPDASLSPSNSLSALSPSMMLDRGAATADAITENDPLSKWAQRAEMEREAARTPGKTSHHQRWLLGLQNNAPPPPLASSTPQNSRVGRDRRGGQGGGDPLRNQGKGFKPAHLSVGSPVASDLFYRRRTHLAKAAHPVAYAHKVRRATTPLSASSLLATLSP